MCHRYSYTAAKDFSRQVVKVECNTLEITLW